MILKNATTWEFLWEQCDEEKEKDHENNLYYNCHTDDIAADCIRQSSGPLEKGS